MATPLDQLTQLFSDHIAMLQSRVRELLTQEKLSGLIIHSGQLKRYFLDDIDYPFVANPHFKHWLPVSDVPNCWLMVNGTDKPKLIYHQPVDFWHKVVELEDDFWTSVFDIQILSVANQVESLLPNDLSNFAYIGEHLEVARALGFEELNPELVLNFIHYHRAYKTPYEMLCMRQANVLGVTAHRAAKQAFLAGCSEYDIHQAYCSSIKVREKSLPYPNIIALNQNAAVLHYTQYELNKPPTFNSFLIDAGANFKGYASDITRTYSAEQNEFSALIAAMNAVQLQLISELKPGMKYGELHVRCHQLLAEVLVEFKLVNISAEQAFDQLITTTFLPHGLGHHLGLQVHDMGGFMADERGTHVSAPEQYPFLRTTRLVETNQVLTIEPGLYFIDSLLSELNQSAQSAYINWDKVEALKPFGGIRIEDNVIVHADNIENMTRDAGL